MSMWQGEAICNEVRMLAANWRKSQPMNRKTKGVVLVFDGRVYGWKDRIRDPDHEIPGAFAVDVDGRVWQAIGGDNVAGATSWKLIQS